MMNKTFKLLSFLICLFIVALVFNSFIYPFLNSDDAFSGFSGDYNNTIIICSATGDMKGLEVGLASYAGKGGIPLILTSKTIPYPINEWLPLFKDKANIKKVILVGPISNWQVDSLRLLNVQIERISGSSKAEILTEIAEKTYKSQNTVVITASDPSASFLGAFMDVPVFVVAEPGKYTSSNSLEPEYSSYISKYNISKVIVVGNVSSGILSDLNSLNRTVEEIKGNDSFKTSVLVSDRVIDLEKQRGIDVNSAYCGFYGELPSIIPLAMKNNSIILVDPTLHMDEAVSYLKNNGIDNAIITRNGPADYLQMEEPDFVSATLINKLNSAGISTSQLTNFRTINEATGLFETKMMAAELLMGTSNLWNFNVSGINIPSNQVNLANLYQNQNTTTYPPTLAIILNGGNWMSNTGSHLTIIQIGLNQWFYGWEGIHPYIWQRNNDSDWYCYSASQYSWHWIHANKTDEGILTNNTNDTWTVEYLSDDKVYYRVYWVKKGSIWEEIHTEDSFNWKNEFNTWICYPDKGDGYFILFPTVF